MKYYFVRLTNGYILCDSEKDALETLEEHELAYDAITTDTIDDIDSVDIIVLKRK
jgi:hypothetical protein